METKQRQWTIYALADPRDSAIRYVGWAFNLRGRIVNHKNRARHQKTHKANWLNSLAALNLDPVVICLETGTGNWAESERNWIAHYINLGADLTNATAGGEGVVGLVFSSESRAKMAAAKKGRKQTPEAIEKAHAPLRGRKHSPETKAKISATKKGHSVSEETIEKLRAHTGWHHTSEAKAKISTAGGRACSEETKAKISASHKGKKLTEEHKAKLSASHKGKVLTEEHKSSIRASSGGWHHTEETKAKISAARKNGST